MTPVKIRGEVPIPIVEALPTTEPPKYIMAVLCAAAEHGALITRKRGNCECIAI